MGISTCMGLEPRPHDGLSSLIATSLQRLIGNVSLKHSKSLCWFIIRYHMTVG